MLTLEDRISARVKDKDFRDWRDRVTAIGGCAAPVRLSGAFQPRTGWKKAVAAVGVPHLHFHDLRHTGNTLAARTKVSTKDLMARMGHDSSRAALIYQHATDEADKELAAGLNALIAEERTLKRPTSDEDDGDGAAGVLVPAG